MPAPTYRINQRQLMVEMKASDPVLKRVADQVMKESFFDPAVAELRAEFEAHKVTQEIEAGAGGTNITDTLQSSFREDEDGDVPPNLWGFIGFNEKGGMTPEEALEPIRERLDPTHPDGPKLVYVGRDKEKMKYNYVIKAPDESAIHADERTSLFWATGLSWVRRIEQGIPGIAHFLNVDRKGSRSGAGIQVAGVVRSGGRFKPVSYLSKMLNNFLRRAVGRSENGRSV